MNNQKYRADGILIGNANMIIPGISEFDVEHPDYYIRLFFKGDDGEYCTFEGVLHDEDADAFLDRVKKIANIPFDKWTYGVLSLCMGHYRSNYYAKSREEGNLKLKDSLIVYSAKDNEDVDQLMKKASDELTEVVEKKKKGEKLPLVYQELANAYQEQISGNESNIVRKWSKN